MNLLKKVSSSGLCPALQSYHTRAAVVSEELYDRLDLLHQVCGELRGELAQERKAQEEVEKRVAVLEAEWDAMNAKRTAELEQKQSTIAKLQTQQSNLSATNAKLLDEMAKYGASLDSSRREVTERGRRIESLEKELEGERRAKLLAEESARSDQLALQGLKVELEGTKAAHQTALVDLQSAEARLKHATSEEGRREIIEAYRQGPVGKVEVALAIKAGFDYLRGRLPSDSPSSSDLSYPPRV